MSGILRLSVQNLLRVKVAEVRPDGSLVIVAGSNDQGKSSVLNSIALALSGKDVPAQPIHAGENEGHVILETDEYVITRRFTTGGAPTLEVRDRSGAKLTSPQTKLDALYSRVTFDPLVFTRMLPEQQLATLKRIVGLDFTALDAEHTAKYEERTNVNRQIRDKEAALRNINRDGTAPENEVSVAELMGQLEKVQQANAANADKRLALSEWNDGIDTHEERVITAKAQVEAAEKALATAKDRLKSEEADLKAQIAGRDTQKEIVSTLKDEPTDVIANAIRNAETINAAVRNNAKWNEEHKASLKLKSNADALTARLEAIEQEKSDAMRKTTFPVDGLSFGAAGVLYKDVPFEQAGTAVKIRTSVAIACSLAPKLPIMLVRDGSLLDDASTKLLAEEAEKHGLQIWMEVVSSSEDAALIMEDGVGRVPAKKPAKKK